MWPERQTLHEVLAGGLQARASECPMRVIFTFVSPGTVSHIRALTTSGLLNQVVNSISGPCTRLVKSTGKTSG